MGSQQSLYSRLDPTTHEIRFIHIQPGTWDDPILCELKTVSLDSKPDYQTLSYAWGDPFPTKPILLEDVVLDVRANLWAALRRLRRAEKERVIWIDALCIHQEDYEERSQQVMLMGSIYSKCREVIMWLGDGLEEYPINDKLTIEEGETLSSTGSSQRERREIYLAFLIVKQLGSNYGTKHTQELPCITLLNRDRAISNQNQRAVRRFKKGWEILGTIMELPYWSRIWTVQESILPPIATVVLGSLSIGWSHFYYAYDALEQPICCYDVVRMIDKSLLALTKFMTTIQPLNTLRTHKNLRLKTLELHNLLPTFFSRKATDPRDKVYAILSLIEIWGERQQRVIPDYSPMNSPRNMFKRLTLDLIRKMKSLEFLIGQCRRRSEAGYPSWIVDWGLQPDPHEWGFELANLEKHTYYSATGSSEPDVKPLSNDRLKTKGMFIDEVLAVGANTTLHNWKGTFPTLEKTLDLGAYRRNGSDPYKGGGTWVDAHWQTMCGGLRHSGDAGLRRTTTNSDDGASYKRCEAMLVDGGMTCKLEERIYRTHETNAVITAAVSLKSVFVTKEGYLGLGPAKMQVGDHVFLVPGSNVPFILAPLNNSISNYRIVGDCYLQGIMNGEAYESRWERDSRYIIIH